MPRQIRILVVMITTVVTSFLLSSLSHADLAAGTPLIKWTAPTMNTDGSTIPATGTTALKEYRIYLNQATTPWKVIAHPALQYQAALGEIPAGNHSIRMTAVNQSSQESALTNALSFACPNCPAPKPQPPGSVQVQ